MDLAASGWECASVTLALTVAGSSWPDSGAPSATKATPGGTLSKRSGTSTAVAGASLPASSRSQTRKV